MILLLLIRPALAADAPPTDPAHDDAGPTSSFTVGSYGRVEAGTDLGGGAGDPVTVTAHPGRLLEDPYVELDLGWQLHTASGADFRALVTPALSGDLFHYTGAFDASLAIRNLYAQADDFGVKGLGVWAGSRMYRGDDVYLLDFWPLDNLNTLGGGAHWRNERLNVAAHVGFNRLSADDWQYQSLDETTPGSVGASSITYLDRQRTIGSLKASYDVPLGDVHVRPKVYGELHNVPAGTRLVETDGVEAGVSEDLPAETGVLFGGELSAYGWSKDSYVNVFYRHATGIAAVGELTVPTAGFALDSSVNASREDLGAVALNQELGLVSIAAGAYLRSWADADANVTDPDDGWEWVASIRPGLYPTRFVAVQAELSHEAAYPAGLDPRTNVQERPAVTRLSLMPGVQLGKGTFARPNIHLRYTLSLVNQDALDRLDPADTRVAAGPVQHSLGIGAEWWIASQGYR